MPQWLVDILGEDLAPVGRIALAAIVVILLAMLMIWLAKRAFGGLGLMPRGRQAPRLAVSDVLAVDDKRKLILVRRDGTEHLVLVGGANDVLLEGGIRRGSPELASEPSLDDPYVRPAPGAPPLGPAPRVAPAVALDERALARMDEVPAPDTVRERRADFSPAEPRVLADRAADAGDENPRVAPAAAGEAADQTRLELEAALQAARAAMPDLALPPPDSVPATRGDVRQAPGAPQQAADPADPVEPARRPLSVRSFATAIQNRKPSVEPLSAPPAVAPPRAPEPQPTSIRRAEPVSAVPAAASPEPPFARIEPAVSPPASVQPPRSQLLRSAGAPATPTVDFPAVEPAAPRPAVAAPEAGEPTLEDVLAAEFDNDFVPPAAPSPPAAVEREVPMVKSPVDDRPTDPGVTGAETPRKLTLEEEMERLLGDFGTSMSRDTRR